MDSVQVRQEAVKGPVGRKGIAEMDDEDILRELKENSIKLIKSFAEEVDGMLDAKKEDPGIGKTAGYTSMLSTFVKGYKDTATLLMTVLKYIKTEKYGASTTSELIQLRERLRVLETDIVMISEKYPAVSELITLNQPEETGEAAIESF